MNPIEYLVQKGFRVTSDPTKYRSGIWGKRDYTVDGYNHDAYCGGYHRAYDLAKRHLAPIPSVCDGVVSRGTNAYGNFGGTVVVANRDLGIQVIYGHLARNIKVKTGQKVRQGETLGYQSYTNYANVSMSSHLHIQFQHYGYIPNEHSFVCRGIDPLKINISARAYESAWLWHGKIALSARIKVRDFPSTSGKVMGLALPGELHRFDKLFVNEGLWWLRIVRQNDVAYIAVGPKEPGITFRQAGDGKRLWGKVSGLDTSRGKE